MTINYYNKNAQIFCDHTFDANMAPGYDLFLKYIFPKTHILDAGCGSGRDTLFFQNSGFKVTAFDASKELVSIASKKTNQEIYNHSFDEMNYIDQFDGIWANASLLHVPKNEMEIILPKFIKALKKNGIWFLSFKYGTTQRIDEKGRLFNDYNEKTLTSLIESYPSLKILEMLKTEDRLNRKDVFWVYSIVKKI